MAFYVDEQAEQDYLDEQAEQDYWDQRDYWDQQYERDEQDEVGELDELVPEHPMKLQSGYDYQFIEEPSDDLKCLICLSVARDPQQHGDGGCGKIFCTNCIKKHKQKNDDKCPNCRKVLTTFKDERSKQL